MIETIIENGEERRLGCLVPTHFPTAARTFEDSFSQLMLTKDEIRAELANRPDKVAWKRRQRFAGSKYIRNQHNHGSCNGFSTAAILSRLRELRGEPYVCLSGADAYSQMNGGRDNGSVLSDGVKVCVNGIAPESLVPWNQIYTSQISEEAKAARKNFKGYQEYAVDSEEELATAMLLGHLGVIAVHATNSYNQQNGDGLNLGGNGVGNHSTGCQDIRLSNDGTIEFDQPNSWDVSWCDGGYSWLRWANHLRETVKYHRFWILVSTGDDTSDGSTPPKIN